MKDLSKPLVVTRILVEEDYGVPVREAERRGITADFLFIRDDGWVLGAPKQLYDNAFRLYSHAWIAIVDLSTLPSRPAARSDS